LVVLIMYLHHSTRFRKREIQNVVQLETDGQNSGDGYKSNLYSCLLL